MMFSVVNALIRSVGQFNIFVWFFMSSLTWLILYTIYISFMRSFLQKMQISKEKHTCLIEVIWRICFNAISVLVIMSSVNSMSIDMLIVSKKWKKDLETQLDICKIDDDMNHPGIKTIFVLHSSYHVLSAVHTWYYKGLKNTEFFQTQSIFAAYVLTYVSKCSLFGMTLLLLASRTALTELIAKFIFLVGYITDSKNLRIVAKVICFYHICLWMETFFWTFPLFLTNNKTISSEMTKAKLNSLIILDFLLWLYVIVSILDSIFSRSVLSMIFQAPRRPFTLEFCLFGHTDLLIASPRPIRHVRIETINDSVEEEEVEADQRIPQNVTKKNLNFVAAAIRCKIMLARKLQRLRWRKTASDLKKRNTSKNSPAQSRKAKKDTKNKAT